MTKALLIFIIALSASMAGYAQFITNFGVNTGVSYANQNWWPKNSQIEIPATGYKPGAFIFLSAEKRLNRLISIRPEIGYIQKGFKNKVEIHFPDGTIGNTRNKNIIYHELAFNAGCKFTPFKGRLAPYAVIGIHTDYMFAYEDIKITEQASGLTFHMYKSQIEDYNKWGLGLNSCIGLMFGKLLYIEFEYVSTSTDKFESSTMRINEDCYNFKLGINLNQFQLEGK